MLLLHLFLLSVTEEYKTVSAVKQLICPKEGTGMKPCVVPLSNMKNYHHVTQCL